MALDKTLSFNVEIKDKNDNRPEFNRGTIRATISENIAEGTENMYYCMYEPKVCII